MKKFLILPLLCLSMTVMAACSNDDTPAPETEQTTNPIGSGETRTLVAYFSAQGHTQAVAERIDRIQDEAYNGLRPEVANLPDAETIAAYDTLFVGSPCWWHQPAIVVCTFLESYDLSGKVVIPFFTYGATKSASNATGGANCLPPPTPSCRRWW